MTHDADVIVVGGGPAGSSTAFFLARAGVDVLVLDRAHFPRDKPCAEYLSPQASRVLHEMGALERLETLGPAHLSGMRVIAPNGAVVHGEFAAAHGFRGFRDYGLAIRRLLLDQVLLEQARHAGARVCEGATVRDIARDHGRVVGVTVQNGSSPTRTFRGRVIVGADGLRSVVARRAKLGRHGRWPRRVSLIAHFAGVEGLDECGEMHVASHGYVGFAKVDSGLANVALVVPASRAPEMAGDAAGFLQRNVARFPAVAARLTKAEVAGNVRAVGEFNWRARRAWLPGLVLVGDAADFFDPFTGEGIYTALRGGELLAEYVAQAVRASQPNDADAALRAYDEHRKREFKNKWTVERVVGVAVGVPFLINRAARVLSEQKVMADLLVGVTGDFVPASQVLRVPYIARLLLGAIF